MSHKPSHEPQIKPMSHKIPDHDSRQIKNAPSSGIKTGSFERRLSLTKAGLLAGTRMAGHMTGSLFSSKEKRQEKRKKILSEQAHYLVNELGKLKGSVVKIGQVMALYGEHFLPPEVTEALHTLEENTQALEWPLIEDALRQEIGQDKLNQLDIEQTPIGTASLGQVHKATIRASGEQICLKVQYPGVAKAIDSDLNAVAQLLRLARIVTFGPAFDDWLEEVRLMMHREVNYTLEAETTAHFNDMLKDDERFVVPRVYLQFSTRTVLATSYEHGENIASTSVSRLSQSRRNALARSALSLFLQELFVWHEIQTDPNFGNYRIRIDEGGERDKIVLLDFGAVQKYPPAFIHPVCQMISAAYHEDLDGVIKGGISLKFMQPDWPDSVLKEFAEVCIAVLEPLARSQPHAGPESFNSAGEYCWKKSNLPTRIARRAALSAISRYFKVPPKEFVFLNRKLVGVYTFISVLDGQFNGDSILAPYLDDFTARVCTVD
jgi:predicted unusual protein kinase regulating ubiquinone biosynthesis (AarF/ABC1/UbiB family)